MTHDPSAGSQRAAPFSPAVLATAGFTAFYMAIALVASVQLQNSEFIFYFVVMCVLITAVGLLHWRVRLPLGALWGLSIWGLAHMAGGLMPIPDAWPRLGEKRVLYNLWLIPDLIKYDQLVHAAGFGLVTWICWTSLKQAFDRRGVPISPTLGLLTLCAAGGMGFGAANEVVEFVAVLTLPGTNVGGYENTGWDLVANLAGCVMAALMIAAAERR